MSNETDAFDRNIPQALPPDEALLLLSQAQKTIEQLQEDKKRAWWFFKAVCDYDIRAPLQAIRGYLELILRDAEGSITEHTQADLAGIRKNADKIEWVINTTIYILRAERIRTDSKEEPAEEIDLIQIIQDETIANTDYLKIDITPDNLPNVLVDQFRLQQVIIDIVSILSKDIGEGQVILSVNTNKDWVIIRVSNAEVSLGNDIMETIDEMKGASTSFISGYIDDGLILSIDQYFIELFGGRLEIDSNEDIGTTVTIFLPKAP